MKWGMHEGNTCGGNMLGFSLKFIDSERMILDDWMTEFEVFESYGLWESDFSDELPIL